MKFEPLVTIYIPTFNRSNLVRRAVESVLSQTYRNIEVIVVDDGSSDDTSLVIEQLQKRDKRVRFYTNERSKGACGARNTAIYLAHGELITGLDDDDYFLPKRIAMFVDAWRCKSSNVQAISSCYLMKTKLGKIRKIGGATPRYVKNYMLFHHNFIGNQLFTTTALLRDINGFDETMPMWQDFDLWTRLTKKTDCLRIPDATYVIDVSHEHERISDKKKDVTELARRHIIKKHDVNCFEIRGIDLQLKSYQVVGKANVISRGLHKFKIHFNYWLNSLFHKFYGVPGES